jgi:hypothetical protein
MNQEIDYPAIIKTIIDSYPESEWIEKCHKSLPDFDDLTIKDTIMILCGGDVFIVDENGNEQSDYKL